MRTNSFDLLIHLLGESCYKANCTLAAAHGCVAYMDVGEGRELGAVSFATPWNRQKIAPACSAYNPSMDINNYSASWRLALRHRKRTLHLVQLRILGSMILFHVERFRSGVDWKHEGLCATSECSDPGSYTKLLIMDQGLRNHLVVTAGYWAFSIVEAGTGSEINDV
jgi:hypothetical protein